MGYSKPHPARSRAFRLLTIGASGIGSFTLGLWGTKLGFGNDIAELPPNVFAAILATLCMLTAALAAMSFFAGVDESAEYIYQETHIDALTGIHTRAAMLGKIAEAVAATLRNAKPMFLIDIDIDRFKSINNSIGYDQGDQLIHAFAERLKVVLPDSIVKGRIGAGEFAVLVPDTQEMGPIDLLVERLIEQLMQPYRLPSHLQSVNVSIGIVALPKDGLDPVILLRRSNLALQHARASGIGNWSMFHREMARIAEYRQWIEAELNTAFMRGDFEVHYQPQLDLISGRIVGYEALLRWRHPKSGMISPAEFIPIAEETGMINVIGDWVLRKACNDVHQMPPDCFVAVNISPIQFMNKDFLVLLRETVSKSGVDPQRLELEVTETAMMQDRDRAASILKELADMGLSVAVDDFGTGYSNLSYLIDFTFKKLKIDKSFVRRLETDENSSTIISTIVGLSRALGVHTVAEGVETENQATVLRAAGCDIVQGYLFGKPGPLIVRGDTLQPVYSMALN